jgi:UDP-glucose 4-epimerase
VKVLVTGGSGFIGSHVVDKLTDAGHEPRIFDLAHSLHHDGGVETVTGDLLDTKALRKALRDCDAVMHLAAVSDVNHVVANPKRAELVNVRGTASLLEAARDAEIGRVVYASTIWVYDDAQGVEPLDETTQLSVPRHLYTATKLTGESYCRSYDELYGLEHTVVRFGIPYGPRARPSTVLAAFVARAKAGEPLTVTGDGSQSRRFVYVEDLAAGTVAALAPAAAGRTYNLVGDESVTILEIAQVVKRLVRDVEILHGPDRPGDLRPAAISGARALAELGWRATTPFEAGVRRYIAWLNETVGRPRRRTAARMLGIAAAVLRQEL